MGLYSLERAIVRRKTREGCVEREINREVRLRLDEKKWDAQSQMQRALNDGWVLYVT